MSDRKAPTAILHEKFVAKLASSGLDLKDAKKLGMETYTAHALEQEKMNVPHHDCFTIPYYHLGGDRTGFYRVRYLVETKKGFAKLTDGKSLRYAQPPETINEVYMPPTVSWANIAADTKQPIIITEGELKSALGCKLGFNVAGLGGVWCFRSSASGLPLLPWFAAITWKGRKVYITYDSDASSNLQVMQAENTLARALTKLGAQVHIVRLPPCAGGAKQGLDDFLLGRGKEDFQFLVDKATPFKEAEKLHEMNEKFIYIRNPGLIIRLAGLQRLSPRAFTDHAELNNRWEEIVTTEKGGSKVVEKVAPKEWLKWPYRAEAECVTYAPGKGLTVGNALNVWTGWGCEPVVGDISPWTELLDFVFKGADKDRKWFEQWCASPIQNPGQKMATAAVLWGAVHGTGKSLIGSTLRAIYGKNSGDIGDANLYSNHNEWAENKQFIVGEEITGGATDKRGVADRLKSMITQKTVRLNPKYIPSYEIPDCINYYFTSNHSDAFVIEQHDRRFFIHEVKGAPLSDAFYKRYGAWLEDGGPSHLMHHFMHHDLNSFDPNVSAPITASKVEMMESSRSDVGRWAFMLREHPDNILIDVTEKYGLDYCLWSTRELLRMYDPDSKTRVTENGLSRELRKSGFEFVGKGVPCRTLMGQFKLWVIREPSRFTFMTATEAGHHYDAERTGVKLKPRGKFRK